LIIEYHLGKANVVADALSRKSSSSSSSLASFQSFYSSVLADLRSLSIRLEDGCDGSLLTSFMVQPSLREQIKRAQIADADLKLVALNLRSGEESEYRVSDDGLIMFRDRIVIPNSDELKQIILEEAHSSAYTMHPSSTKMYRISERIISSRV